MKEKIIAELKKRQDKKYRDFSASLMPTVDKNTVIGVRAPELRCIAKSIKSEEKITDFLHALPHEYYEENNLHAYLINEIKDIRKCVEELDRFLPYVDNWATCDSIRPKCFNTHKKELLPLIDKWLVSDRPYTVRFAIEMLMTHFLDGSFDVSHADKVLRVRSDEYYVKMMVAWYFATALAKQWESVIPYIEEKRLEEWTHRKVIQKACESYRITADRKEYLRSLK